MLICSEKEQISFPFDNAIEILKCSDSTNGICTTEDFPTISAHTNVVPEHTQSDLTRLMSTLEEEIMGLRSKQKYLDEKRRGLLNKILDIKGSIRVFCRIRPIMWSNMRKNDDPYVVDLDKVIVKSAGIKKGFEFDKVFCQNSTQEEVFVEVEPILRSALDGHNVCVFAYGQTGTGKTFTMEGTTDQPGIVPRALKELFQQAALHCNGCVTFSMSMLEVYMGNLKDLLAPKSPRRVYEPVSRCNLNVQVDAKGVVEIEGLSEVPISDFSKASWWYSKGRRARATSSTNVNDVSSRSHCLTRITITHHGDTPESQARISKLWMVDLGGSERLLKTGAIGLTLDEGRAINLSLSALGDVIASLRRRRTHVPYRNSKLTQILRDSLGNESKVLMIVHISPNEEDLGETICSMSFAKRARGIESNHELPQEVKNLRQKRVAELSDEMREAEEEYQKVRNQLQKTQFLLNENSRLCSTASNNAEDEENTPEITKECIKEVTETTPCDAEKPPKRKSLPHFMASTAASRLRHNAAERQNHFTARVLRSGTRSSIQLSASQSLSFLEPRLKAVVKNSGKNHHEKAGKNFPTEAQNCNNDEPKPSNLSRNKPVTPSLMNGKPSFPRHRRRMSDLL